MELQVAQGLEVSICDLPGLKQGAHNEALTAGRWFFLMVHKTRDGTKTTSF